MKTNTILFDSGYSYFAAVDTGIYNDIDLRDSGVPIVQSGKTVTLGKPEKEVWWSQWFYQHDKQESEHVKPQDLMTISTTGSQATEMYPPLDTAITSVSLWVQIYDDMLGAGIRPSGSALRESRVYFKYTPSYVRSEIINR